MLTKGALIQRGIAWEKAHPPNTHYTETVLREVCGKNLPNGANLWTQIAAQFTGKEEAIDLVQWDNPERRAPYSNNAALRLTLDGKPDCSSFWYDMYEIVFGINIGTWTEGQLSVLHSSVIPWKQRRVADHVLYNFKAAQGRHASHAANIVIEPDPTTTVGMIGQTTSPSNPFRFDPDTYATTSRIGCFRVLSEEQFLSLIVNDHKSGITIPNWPTLFHGIIAPAAVVEYKIDMLKIYPKCGLHVSNSAYLDECVKVTIAFQQDIAHRDELGAILKVDGEVGPKTRYAIAVALTKLG